MKQLRIYRFIFGFSFWLGIFMFGGFLASCEKLENPLLKAQTDKQQCVFDAEKRSEQINWELVDSHETIFNIPHWGLDAIYHTEESKKYWNSLTTLRDHTQKIDLTHSELSNIAPHLEHFEKKQNDLMLQLKTSIEAAEKNYCVQKEALNQRLNRKEIDIIQYDNLLTILKKTFIQELRHGFNESEILMRSSVNLQEVLTLIHDHIASKSWDRLKSQLTEK